MFTCPYCGTEVKEAHNICGQCLHQVKCVNPECRSILEPDKPVCLVCGTSILKLDVTHQHSQQRNKIKYWQKRTPKSSETELEMDFTDEAASRVAPAMNLIVEPDATFERREFGTKPDIQKVERKSAQLPPLQDEEDIAESEYQSPEKESGEAADDTEAIANSYFKPHNDDIRPTREFNDYLTSSITAKDKQQHFTVMYVQAYFEEFGVGVSRDKLIEVTKSLKADAKNNFSKHLNSVIENYFIEQDGVLTPYHAAARFIEKTIVPAVQNPSQQSASSTSTSSKKRSSSQPSDEEKQSVKSWVEQKLELNFDVLKLGNKPANWVLFVYHILIYELEVAETVLSTLAHTYAVEKFQQMPIERERFTYTANKLKNRGGKLAISQGGEYYLTDSGKAEVKKIMGKS